MPHRARIARVGADLGRHPPNPGDVGDPDPAEADLIARSCRPLAGNLTIPRWTSAGQRPALPHATPCANRPGRCRPWSASTQFGRCRRFRSGAGRPDRLVVPAAGRQPHVSTMGVCPDQVSALRYWPANSAAAAPGRGGRNRFPAPGSASWCGSCGSACWAWTRPAHRCPAPCSGAARAPCATGR